MIRILLRLCMALFATSALAVNWEAVITNTNTPVLDSDIHAALTKGMAPNFATTFPSRQYGIHVLLDTQTVPQLNGDLVYMALGLSHRLPNGLLELPAGRFSEMLVVPQGMAPDARKDAITQKLTAVAASFSRAMIQNKPVFDQARASRPQATGHWSEWPDYQPTTSGTVSGGQ